MADTIEIPVEIRAYLESLITEAQVPVFDDKAKEELMQYLFERLDKFLAAKIVENMKPEDTEAFIKMNEEGKSREDIDAFIKEHMQNAQEVFTRAFVDFRDFYLTAQTPVDQPNSNQNSSAASNPSTSSDSDSSQPAEQGVTN